MFCISNISLCLEYYIYPSQNVFQFLILFRLIMPDVWYSFPFMMSYFVFINPTMVTNIFSVSFLIALEKVAPLKWIVTGFCIFFEHILDLVIFNLYFYKVYFCIVFKVLLALYADKIKFSFLLAFVSQSWSAENYVPFGLLFQSFFC